MTTLHPTALDLDAITAKRWAEPEDFSPAEFSRAQEFYASMRVHDERLHRVRAHAGDLIRQWTGFEPRDVGSFGIGLNLETSDLDLGIGYPVERRAELMEAMSEHARFLGERNTSSTTTRLVFAFELEDVEVDLSALAPEDFTVANRMLDQIADTMTQPERIAHTWVKHLLRSSGRLEDYAAWKLVTYGRFCPEFNWVPIPEKAGDH
ncbi:hypothetical protein [Streptacidiphilus sp. EB103A]|uniref:hypothetical protein n=1 Tax=Streptacidiphilus sp. EB103A TaxID=3156275 RepID=UPI00351829C1